ncbi:MAG: ArsR/SmtB family transcription factor [Steroidobacterales bacterium]
MVKYNHAALNAVFSALADPTRRGILATLCNGTRSVSALAEPFDMSLAGFTKHLRVLERAGLVRRGKTGRVVQCTLEAEPMQSAASWLAHYQVFWTTRLDALATFLDHKELPCPPNPSPRRSPLSASTATRRSKSGKRGPLPKR